MKTILRLLILLIVVPVALGTSLWMLERRGIFNLDQIEISLSKNNDQTRFMKPLVEDLDRDLEKLRGQSLWRLDLTKITTEISALPWVGSMQLRRSWPNKIELQIQPKQVKFLYMAKNGTMNPVLEDGTFLPPVQNENMPDVVLLRGDDFVKNKKMLSRALTTLEEIPDTGSFSKKTISEIRYDGKEGFWATLMKDAISVKLGENQIVLKSARVSQVLDYLEDRQFGARVIDANLTKKVLVRLRKGP